MKILEECHDHILQKRKYTVTCEKCHSKLEYTIIDLRIYFENSFQPCINYIKCPVCDNRIIVKYE